MPVIVPAARTERACATTAQKSSRSLEGMSISATVIKSARQCSCSAVRVRRLQVTTIAPLAETNPRCIKPRFHVEQLQGLYTPVIHSKSSPRGAESRELVVQCVTINCTDCADTSRMSPVSRSSSSSAAGSSSRRLGCAKRAVGKQLQLSHQQCCRQQFLLPSGYSVLGCEPIQSNAEFGAVRSYLSRPAGLIMPPAVLERLGKALSPGPNPGDSSVANPFPADCGRGPLLVQQQSHISRSRIGQELPVAQEVAIPGGNSGARLSGLEAALRCLNA